MIIHDEKYTVVINNINGFICLGIDLEAFLFFCQQLNITIVYKIDYDKRTVNFERW